MNLFICDWIIKVLFSILGIYIPKFHTNSFSLPNSARINSKLQNPRLSWETSISISVAKSSFFWINFFGWKSTYNPCFFLAVVFNVQHFYAFVSIHWYLIYFIDMERRQYIQIRD